ncbi:shikimate dehydrogenase [Gammaproteobacteria bacterium]|jgi:shikimate dehydrogenase|nr:shikimate dehydrogenase [Pseudomonadota bacterium]MDA9762667.1 shikimate dehydrogenase [Gammaproteobacteria bacterium]MDB4194381.1 shikimate dehydrogenase [Gammaproteobacteria bacterium]MDB9900173.1 shikimate dehydrogenase [Gammaproteobacteria bacterium]MDC0122939.1 shikimate dehydrogenase [Gammaproteobacteria bacterium]|tara:strand:- start:495 stop:1352 length:858 start_codon:yes stop_codon:yes gene_type:complete
MKSYKLGVIGNPIEHSLSPKIHSIFAKQVNIQIDYQAYKVNENDLEPFIKDFFKSGGDGLNITVPHKINCLNVADEYSPSVKLIGAANTLSSNKISNKIYAHTTDGAGFVADVIKKSIPIFNTNVLILGAGGAAQSIIPMIHEKDPASIVVDNRTQEKIQTVLDRYNLLKSVEPSKGVQLTDLKNFSKHRSLADNINLVINTTSAGFEGPFSWNEDIFTTRDTIFYDLSYSKTDSLTPFLKWASHYSDQCHNGIGMLINQAALSFELWTGIKPNTDISENEIFNE